MIILIQQEKKAIALAEKLRNAGINCEVINKKVNENKGEMMQTIDMDAIRYLNLFEKVTDIRTKNCFFYNKFLVFAVPQQLVSKAIGKNGRNVKKINFILGKKVKIVSLPRNIIDAKKFISDIVSPVTFKDLEITPNEIIISGSTQSKASLIGRNRVRFFELEKIIKGMFGKQLKII